MEKSDEEIFEESMEALMEIEQERSDSMSKCGLIRTIVVKHNQSDDVWKQRVTIANTQIFQLGLSNVTETWSHRWLDEEWETHGDSNVEHILESMPNGIYEIVGELYYYGWTSGYEEPEYESMLEVRDFKVQPLTFDQAYGLADSHIGEEEVELTKLIDSHSHYMNWDTQVHHYMKPLEILQAQATALCSIMGDSFWTSRSDIKDMELQQLEAFIHMCMMEIDSHSEEGNKEKRVAELALRIDEEVQKTIRIHKEMFE